MSTATPDARSTISVLAVVGPTAVGKSALAERLASHLAGEIVSADSMQVYRGMDIGTAKTPVSERLVTHHCVDLVDPGAAYSAALYQAAARTAIEDMAADNNKPVVCGGTGLYVRAALDDWSFPRGELHTPLRASLERDAELLGPDALHARLEGLDPRSAALIHHANVRRTIRALEMLSEGESYAQQAERFSHRESVYDTTFLGLTMEREHLYHRIDRRVDTMVNAGLLAEVERLLAAGFREALTAAQAIGYKELVPVIEGSALLDEAVEDIKRATRRYAKRQLTWFRSDPRIRWLDVTETDTEAVFTAALGLIESEVPHAATRVPAPGTWRLVDS